MLRGIDTCTDVLRGVGGCGLADGCGRSNPWAATSLAAVSCSFAMKVADKSGPIQDAAGTGVAIMFVALGTVRGTGDLPLETCNKGATLLGVKTFVLGDESRTEDVARTLTGDS